MVTYVAALCLMAAQAPPAPRAYAAADVSRSLERLERQADRFEDAFEDALEKTVLDDTRRAERLKQQASRLEDEIEKLRDDHRVGKEERKLRERLDRALATASDINNVMLERRFTEDVQTQWNEIRAELNGLASAYGLTALRTP